jgi:hypothetical protein
LANLVLCQLLKDMPSKKRVHLQQSGIISQKHVSSDEKLHTHRLQSSLIHQNKVTMWPYLHDEICKITHTHTHRSCSQVVDLATRGHWISSIFVDGLNNDHWTQDEIVHPDARRFWATYPWHGYEEGVCHKNSSRSCVRGMSNPITPITRILLATERSRRRKKREKQKPAPYKIYSLRHS